VDGVLTDHIARTVPGFFAGNVVPNVAATVVDVTPRAVGSEHFVTTDFNPLKKTTARTTQIKQLKEIK